jgi:CheY-like chemotaxis protein
VFTLFASDAKSMSEPTKAKSQPGRKRKPLIYVVDDEVLLLDLAEASLQAGGYSIKKFQDPEEALKSFLREKTKPDLLISDYAMGKMHGLELIEKCKEAHPLLKTMLVSGTAGAEIILGAPVKVERFLGKPYQPAALLESVQRILKPEGSAGG